MPLKYIYKINGNFIDKNKKNIEKFADETTGHCYDKWGDEYININEEEKYRHCNSKCGNGVKSSYKQKMISDGRVFEDCMPVDGNSCVYNFSITNEELSVVGGAENELETKESYEAQNRVIDLELDSDRDKEQKVKDTDNEGIKTNNEMTTKSTGIVENVEIAEVSALKEINEKKKAVGFSIQGGIDRIFGDAFSGDWRREKFSNTMFNKKENNYVIIFIIIIFLAKITEFLLKYCYSKQNI